MLRSGSEDSRMQLPNRIFPFALSLALLQVAAPTARAQSKFDVLNVPGSTGTFFNSVSNDGETAVGEFVNGAGGGAGIVWSPSDGFSYYPTAGSRSGLLNATSDGRQQLGFDEFGSGTVYFT